MGASARQRRRKRVFKRDGNRCLKCGRTENLTIDHIIPLALGGSNALTNLQTFCQPCNVDKDVGLGAALWVARSASG